MSAETKRVAQILAQVQKLAVEYYQLTGKPLGVTGEIAEFVAAEKLGLKLVEARTPGYDAYRETASGRERIQIKGRAIAINAKPGQRLGAIKQGANCDVVMFVELDLETLEPRGIWEASIDTVRERLNFSESRARKRGAISVSEFKRFSAQVWPEDANG